MRARECTSCSFGIGADIENTDRFAGVDRIQSGPFLNKIFTPNELNRCFSKKMVAQHLAVRYCAKEAVVKAMATINRRNLNYRDIEIVNDKSGAATVRIAKAGFHDFKVHISLSHCEDKAIAFAIVYNTRQNNSD